MQQMIESVRRSLLKWFRPAVEAKKSPQRPEFSRKSNNQPLTPREYEHFFTQILEGVESGWGRVQVLRALAALSHRSRESDWVTWLRNYGEQLLASPVPNRQMAKRMVELGEIDCGELCSVAGDIGREMRQRLAEMFPGAAEEEIKSPIQQVETWFQQGIELFNAGNYAGAIAFYDRALGILPTAPEVWYNRGNAFFHLERYQDAIACYDKALEFKPDKSDAWNNRGNALFKLERMEEAIAAWDKTVEFSPNYHQAWYNRGVVLGYMGCLLEAIESYDKVLAIKPDEHQAWFNRGLVLGNLGRYEEAIASWDKALEYKSDRYETWYNRSIALSNLGLTEEAEASLKQAEALKPI
ncbi:MAG TPA: hypothetical protein DDW76_11535 [Cyanobacteria bacterium UBA11369]|nr:hypothetical protein [Cyanobacteria bacterium UBA11371]HBE49403.1 hypothetical protein [Cyanobacteria bacterium UBA11369]